VDALLCQNPSHAMTFNKRDIDKNWQLLVEGERQGLYECFNIFYEDLYKLGLSLYRDPELVKESIHDLFLELWKIRGKLTDVKNVQQYVITIFKRVLYKAKKGQGITWDELEEGEEFSLVAEVSYEEILIASQQHTAIQQQLQVALSELSERQKQLIRLKYFEQLSFREIADQTSLTERTIYNTLHNAMQVLRKKIIREFVLLVCIMDNLSS
jgi:RNA polymerase sigma factor (sigma-70 family)